MGVQTAQRKDLGSRTEWETELVEREHPVLLAVKSLGGAHRCGQAMETGM